MPGMIEGLFRNASIQSWVIVDLNPLRFKVVFSHLGVGKSDCENSFPWHPDFGFALISGAVLDWRLTIFCVGFLFLFRFDSL
jgi:hypothetical protein